jgi:hypothetical protein
MPVGTWLPLLAALVVAAGCDTAEEEPPVGDDVATAPAPPSPAETAPPEGDPPPELEPVVELPADTVSVTLSEGRLEIPETLPMGRTVFMISNTGGMDHTLEITFESPEARLDPPTAPGETKTLVFTLSRGTWEFYCPIGNHRYQGEEVHVRVGG